MAVVVDGGWMDGWMGWFLGSLMAIKLQKGKHKISNHARHSAAARAHIVPSPPQLVCFLAPQPSTPSRMRVSGGRWQAASSQLFTPDRKRTFLSATQLCDQAIQLLRPRLPAQGQCDLIDINPGPGIWSKALNQALQPRRHVLIENDPDLLKSCLSRLRRLPNNVSRVAETLNHALDPANNLLSQALQDAHARRDSRLVKPNDQLLITANYTGKYISMLNYSGDRAKYNLQLFYRSLTTGIESSDFHKLGAVKLLAWIPEEISHCIVPRSSPARTTQSVRLECTCDINVIVSSHPYHKVASPNYHKFYDVELYDNELVAQRAAQNFIDIPASRRQPTMDIPYFFVEPLPQNLAKLVKLDKRPLLIDEAYDLYHELQRHDPKWLHKYQSNFHKLRAGRPSKASGGSQVGTQKEFALLMNRLKSAHTHVKKIRDVVDPQRDLELGLINLARDQGIHSQAYQSKLAEYRPRLATYHDALQKLFKDNRRLALKVIDDYRALHFTPPTFSWHHRQHEPLLCHPTDFSPNRPLTLLEITPKASFLDRINTVDKQICFDYIVQNIHWSGAATVSSALKTLAGGEDLYPDFVKSIDGIHDPSRGGWWDLDDLRVRILNSEMIIQVALALEKWPFKPSSDRMLEQIQQRRRRLNQGESIETVL